MHACMRDCGIFPMKFDCFCFDKFDGLKIQLPHIKFIYDFIWIGNANVV